MGGLNHSPNYAYNKAALIFNPYAGKLSRAERLLERTTELFLEHGLNISLIPTTGPGSAGDIAKEQIDEGCDLIIAAGGDGTINEVANGLALTDVPLGILPGGTANVLANELGLDMNFERLVSLMQSFVPTSVATGLLSVPDRPDRHFMLMAGAGLDAQIVYNLDPGLKAATGKLAYYLGGFSQVFRPIPEFTVQVDDHEYPASFALISRVRNYGGDLEIARGASLMRNDFEVVLFRGKHGTDYLKYLLGVAMQRVEKVDGCTVLRGTKITCADPEAEGVYVQVDGELAGTLPLTAQIVPTGIKLLVPPQYLAKEQAQHASLVPV